VLCYAVVTLLRREYAVNFWSVSIAGAILFGKGGLPGEQVGLDLHQKYTGRMQPILSNEGREQASLETENEVSVAFVPLCCPWRKTTQSHLGHVGKQR
jgi:hypothetical protein